MTVAPAHLTALLSSDTGRGDSLIQPVRTNEAPGNQIMEAGRGSAFQHELDTSGGDGRPGHDGSRSSRR